MDEDENPADTGLEEEEADDAPGEAALQRHFEFVVDSGQVEARMRLDRFLKAALEELFNESMSRTHIQKLIAGGRVLLDGRPVKASLALEGGERISVTCPAPVQFLSEAEAIPLVVPYEDEHLLVIDKPAGMVVHPGAGAYTGTLVNALLAHCGASLSGIGGVLRPGIVHRLDKDTSGLLVVAKNDKAHANLADQISRRTATRVYLALVEGHPPPQGVIDKPIGRHKTDRKKMAVIEGGRKSVTSFNVIEQLDKIALVQARLLTGRTHQIRVHMASLDCPVVGDIVYNRKSTGGESARARLGLVGQALHASYLSFRHPVTSCLLEFESKPPQDFRQLFLLLGGDPAHVS